MYENAKRLAELLDAISDDSLGSGITLELEPTNDIAKPGTMILRRQVSSIPEHNLVFTSIEIIVADNCFVLSLEEGIDFVGAVLRDLEVRIGKLDFTPVSAQTSQKQVWIRSKGLQFRKVSVNELKARFVQSEGSPEEVARHCRVSLSLLVDLLMRYRWHESSEFLLEKDRKFRQELLRPHRQLLKSMGYPKPWKF